jgi:hypothetical protein
MSGHLFLDNIDQTLCYGHFMHKKPYGFTGGSWLMALWFLYVFAFT